MGSTGKLQKGDVVLAHIEDVEATVEGFSFTASSVLPKGRYNFVTANGPSRIVDVYEVSGGPGRPTGKARYVTVKPDSLNDAVRQVIATAKQAAGDNRRSQYLKDALREAKAQVDRLRAALQRAEAVLALPEGDPRRIGAVKQATEDRARHKDALADAADLQFDLENWISGKADR